MGHRILVIEDNLGDALLIQEALNAGSIPATLQVITDGEKALKEIASIDPFSVPDLVIIDLNLPRIGGMAILQKIRSVEKFSRTGVMVLTSSQAAHDRVRAEQLGANAFVTKPLTLDEFLQAIGSAIRLLLAGGSQLSRERSTQGSPSAHRPERRRFEHQSTGLLRAARRG